MIKYILTLIIIAFITYSIEFPIMMIGFYKLINFRYLNEIVLVVNFLTNIVLNGIVIPIESQYVSDILGKFLIFVFEIFIIFVEYFLYKIAFKEFSGSIVFKKKLLFTTAIANFCSFALGLVVFH